MTTNLPKGIVTNSESVPGAIGKYDTVDVEQIFQLWRVYTTNKDVLQNDVGRRLENLFWRIWGNDRIQGNITGTTVARLFTHISTGKGFLESTPVQSPRKARVPSTSRPRRDVRGPPTPPSSLLSSLQRTSSSRLDRRYGQPDPQKPLEARPVPSMNQSPSSSLDRVNTGLPPTILPQTPAESQSAASTRQAPVALPEDSSASSASLVVENVMRPPTPPVSKGRKEPAQAAKRKKTAFVASTAASSRRRPAAVKRKSSQSSASQTPTLVLSRSPASRSRNEFGSDERERARPSNIVESDIREPYLLHSNNGQRPASKRENRTRVSDERIGGSSTAILENQTNKSTADVERTDTDAVRRKRNANVDAGDAKGDWLVERDFRSKFVDKKRQERFSFLLGHSSTSKTGPTLAQSAMEATATIESGEAPSGKRTTKGKKVIVVDDVVPLKAGGVPAPGIIEEEESFAPLPRTKSQLTFLLERDRVVKAQENQKNRKISS